ncbi:MAG TPA: hypothetical protein VFY41_03050 [Nitrososphaeraceae archaeon]|nr:hypothetical protein [Nitrososphaeraceae archaeon]
MIAISVHVMRLLITFQKITIRIRHKRDCYITIHIEIMTEEKKIEKMHNGIEKTDKIKTNLLQSP